jgi:hypothetical protein
VLRIKLTEQQLLAHFSGRAGECAPPLRIAIKALRSHDKYRARRVFNQDLCTLTEMQWVVGPCFGSEDNKLMSAERRLAEDQVPFGWTDKRL